MNNTTNRRCMEVSKKFGETISLRVTFDLVRANDDDAYEIWRRPSSPDDEYVRLASVADELWGSDNESFIEASRLFDYLADLYRQMEFEIN